MKCSCEPRKLSQRINDLILRYSGREADPWRGSDPGRQRRLSLPRSGSSSFSFCPPLSSTRRSPERGTLSVYGRGSRSPSPLALPAAKPPCPCCSRSSSGSRTSRAASLTSIPPSSKLLSPVRLPSASAFCLREPLLCAIRARAASSKNCTVCGSSACRKRRRVTFAPPPSCCCARKPPLRLASSVADASAWRPRITRPAMATLGAPGGRPWDSVSARPDLTYRATSAGRYVRPTWARRYTPRPPPDPAPEPEPEHSCLCPDCVLGSSCNSSTN